MKLISWTEPWLVVCLSLTAVHLVVAEQPQKQPLRIALTVAGATSAHPRFRVELFNTGDRPLILSMGMMLGNANELYPLAIHLSLTKSDRTTYSLELKGPAGIGAGRIDAYVIPLPPGASFSLPVDLADYAAAKQKIFELELEPGSYTLSAEYVGQTEDAVPMEYIHGAPAQSGVQSNRVAFTLTQPLSNRYRPIPPPTRSSSPPQNPSRSSQ